MLIFFPSRSIDAVFPPDETDKNLDDDGRLPWASGAYLSLTAGAATVGGPRGSAGGGGASIEAGEEVKLPG